MAPVFIASKTLHHARIHAVTNTVSGDLPTGLPRTRFVLALKSLGSNLMLTGQHGAHRGHWPVELYRKMDLHGWWPECQSALLQASAELSCVKKSSLEFIVPCINGFKL